MCLTFPCVVVYWSGGVNLVSRYISRYICRYSPNCCLYSLDLETCSWSIPPSRPTGFTQSPPLPSYRVYLDPTTSRLTGLLRPSFLTSHRVYLVPTPSRPTGFPSYRVFVDHPPHDHKQH